MRLCPKCREREKMKSCGYCRVCKSAYDSERRKSLRAMKLDLKADFDELVLENESLRRTIAALKAKLAVSAIGR